jgi:hypothetical protein
MRLAQIQLKVWSHQLPINVRENELRLSLYMVGHDIIRDPQYDVVLECALDKLVKDIRSQELVNVGPWKHRCKRLGEYA